MTEEYYDEYYPQPYEKIGDVLFFANHKEDERVYLMEECAELIQACTKTMRGHPCARDNLVEEMAHVYLTLNHVRCQEGITVDEIQDRMNAKIAVYGFANIVKKEMDFIKDVHDEFQSVLKNASER